MTKTLTEQWREGTLPDGHYYVQYDKCSPFIKDAYGMIELKRCIDSEKIEVLASVPSYDEWHKVKDLGLRPDYTDHIEKWEDCARLTKKLEIATKALKEYANRDNYHDFDDDYDEPIWNIGSPIMHAELALKEMEGVK